VRQTYPQTLAYVLFLGQLRLGTLLLEAWSTPEALGQWTAATRLLEVWSFVPWALTAPWYPAAVRAGWGSVERARLVRKMALWSLGSAAVLALPISLGASVWVDWIYGDAFAPTAPLLTVAAFNLFPWFSYLFWVRWMHLQHRSHAVPVFSALYVVVQAALAALWIPADGALGAAWAALVSGISVMSLAYAYGMFTNAPSPENSAKEINT
jgi:PST family polysaccharide transporter